MKRIGIISDTHGFWDPKYEYYFRSVMKYGMQETSERLKLPIALRLWDLFFVQFVEIVMVEICAFVILRFCVSSVKMQTSFLSI